MLKTFYISQIFSEELIEHISNYNCSYTNGRGLITFIFSPNKNLKKSTSPKNQLIKNNVKDYEFSFQIYDRYYNCECTKEPNYIISGELKLVNGQDFKHIVVTFQNKITKELLFKFIEKFKERDNGKSE